MISYQLASNIFVVKAMSKGGNYVTSSVKKYEL